MDKYIFTEALKTKIVDRKVTHALFTTYSFETDFFELEVIPGLLNYSFSPSEIIRRPQIELAMRESKLKADVYYDQIVFNANTSPSLNCGYIPVNIAPFAFHPKLIILQLLDETKENNKKSLLVIAGSNNLTKAGWWDNIECSHGIKLSNEYCPSNVKQSVSEALSYFVELGSSTHTVARNLQSTLDEISTTTSDQNTHFFFHAKESGTSFPSFIEQHLDKKADALELISPYFTNDDSDELLEKTLLERVNKIDLFLPIELVDQEQIVQVSEAFYNTIKNNESIHWSEWNPNVAKELEVSKENYRKLHAKTYHFQYVKGDSWLFIGSVNCSKQAFYNNVEAGFLVKVPTIKSLLKDQTNKPEFAFMESDDPSSEEQEASHHLPALQLIYDWHSKEMHYSSSKKGILELLDSDKEIIEKLIFFEENSDKSKQISNEIWESILQKSALILARFTDGSGDSSEGWTIIEQRNIYIRPSKLVPLSIQQILKLYASLSFEQRMNMIEEQVNKTIRLGKLDSDEFIALEEIPEGYSNFFSEFTEINSAFWQLQKRLQAALDHQQYEDILYYIEGNQTDTLNGMIKAIEEKSKGDQDLTGITQYLILLSIRQIISKFKNSKKISQDRVQYLLKKIRLHLIQLRENKDSIKIESVDRTKFFNWFEEEFKKEYHTKKGNEA